MPVGRRTSSTSVALLRRPMQSARRACDSLAIRSQVESQVETTHKPLASRLQLPPRSNLGGSKKHPQGEQNRPSEAPKSTPDRLGEPKSAQEPPKSAPRAPKSVQKRPQASQSAQQAPQGRPKSAQERPSAARTLPKTALNRAQIATKTNFYVLLSLSLLKSNSLSILFAIFPMSFMSPTLNFIGFLEGKRYFSPNRYFQSTSKKSPKIHEKNLPKSLPRPSQNLKKSRQNSKKMYQKGKMI